MAAILETGLPSEQSMKAMGEVRYVPSYKRTVQ